MGWGRPLPYLRIPRLRPRTLQAIRIPCTLRWISRRIWRIQNLRISLLRIRILRQDFFMDICPDTTQMCSERKSQNVESHLSKSFETKKSLKIKHLLGLQKKKKKKNLVGGKKKKKKKKKKS